MNQKQPHLPAIHSTSALRLTSQWPTKFTLPVYSSSSECKCEQWRSSKSDRGNNNTSTIVLYRTWTHEQRSDSCWSGAYSIQCPSNPCVKTVSLRNKIHEAAMLVVTWTSIISMTVMFTWAAVTRSTTVTEGPVYFKRTAIPHCSPLLVNQLHFLYMVQNHWQAGLSGSPQMIRFCWRRSLSSAENWHILIN